MLEVGKKYTVPIAVLKNGQRSPVYDLKHNDPDNGQHHYHYHGDSRFRGSHRINADDVIGIVYEERECVSATETDVTDVHLISKAKLRCRRIVNGLCPHKGFDLTSVSPIDGVIECPMHGLKFNARNKKLLSINRRR